MQIKAVYVSLVYVYMLCTEQSGQLECNYVFSGLGSDLSVGRMVRGEGAWVVCVCISYTGGEGQLGCNFLWSGRGDWGNMCSLYVCFWYNYAYIVSPSSPPPL